MAAHALAASIIFSQVCSRSNIFILSLRWPKMYLFMLLVILMPPSCELEAMNSLATESAIGIVAIRLDHLRAKNLSKFLQDNKILYMKC